jgi:hypothetical protein
MRRVVTAMLGTAAVVLMATSVYAQAPNFAGKWTPDAEKNAAMNPNAGGGGRGGGRGGGMGGGEVTIAQDAKTLTVTRTTQAGEMKLTYNLDGSPSKNMAMGRGGQTEVTSTAKWDGAKLVITSDNGQSITYAMDGAWLVQSTTSPGRGGGDPVTRSTYYKKGM